MSIHNRKGYPLANPSILPGLLCSLFIMLEFSRIPFSSIFGTKVLYCLLLIEHWLNLIKGIPPIDVLEPYLMVFLLQSRALGFKKFSWELGFLTKKKKKKKDSVGIIEGENI